ncbi:ABC-F family ATP-binding cassette domain-containing protein [Tuwongella immobilis]|nr:ABC-F family ATP-binding cassette domain-containing protein [Tuwongella immobilis]
MRDSVTESPLFGVWSAMSLLVSVQGISKNYGRGVLFSDLSLDLKAGERVGLIGPNGAGKSTLLKILADLETPDDGTRTVRRGIRIGYVAQDDTFPAGQSVCSIVVSSLAKEPLEDHEKLTRAQIVLDQVGFADIDQPAATLSGGWRKRLSIACQLARQPDLLLMDEPTNHLDLPGVVWLEQLLRSSPFAYLAITHDRAFLRAIADEIIEISRIYPGGYFRSDGNYDTFADRKERFLEAQAQRETSVANQVRRETEWLGRKAAARTRKASSRIEDAMNRRDELADLRSRNQATGSAGIDFVGTGRQTRKLITGNNLSKSLGGRRLFSGLDLILAPGTKLGLLGANGSGKSTLLKLFSGELQTDTGEVLRADGLRVATFEQGRSALDPNIPLRRALCANSDTVIYRDRPMHIIAWAKQFLFHPEQLDLEISALSGGEQARVRIAQLMLQPADLLLLDEPTNDLDIPALEVLEDSLSEFPGAVVLVSHDRELMDRLCTEYVGFDGKGGCGMFGSVSQWLTAMERAESQSQSAVTERATKSEPAKSTKSKTVKLSYREQQELDGIESAIATAEESVVELQAQVESAATGPHAALTAACQALEAAQAKVEQLYARWQELEAKRSGTTE